MKEDDEENKVELAELKVRVNKLETEAALSLHLIRETHDRVLTLVTKVDMCGFPGQAQICQKHTETLDKVSRKLYTITGAVVVLVFLINLMAPWVRNVLHLSP